MEQYDSRCSLTASLPLVAQQNSLLLLETVEHNTIGKSLTFHHRACRDCAGSGPKIHTGEHDPRNNRAPADPGTYHLSLTHLRSHNSPGQTARCGSAW